LNRIPPEMIDEVASDLRLAVVLPTRTVREETRDEIQRAVRMLLGLQQYLQNNRLQEEESLVGTARAVRDDESVI